MLSGPGFVDALIALRARFEADPVLILTQEASVETVSSDYARVAAHYRIAMSDDAIMRVLMDKARFQDAAERLGFPVPRAVHIVGPADLAASEGLAFPCVLKPVVKTERYQRLFKKAYKIESLVRLRELVTEIDGAAELIVQEWIEGGDDAIFFCLQYRDAPDRAVARFTGRKLRSWPPQTGGTASCMPAPEHAAELERLTDAFFTAVGFVGMGSMEYKRDARTGRFVMIEPTVGRSDFQEEVATLNGVNIPNAAYCSAVGQPVPPPCPPARPVGWTVSPIDRWSAEMQPGTQRGFPDGVRPRDAVWRLDDPMPWCYTALDRLGSRLSKLFARPYRSRAGALSGARRRGH